jgi:hypothetical protein
VVYYHQEVSEMPKIEIGQNISYLEVKKMAGELMIQNPLISSVRVTVEKDTLKMCIEYTEFSKKILDKFTEL